MQYLKHRFNCTISVIMLFLSFLPYVFADIKINEIMYNPEGTDNNKEFIELLSSPQINLSDYLISDGDSNDTLTLDYFNSNSNYSLIVEDDYLIKTNNASVYKIGATIGNGISSTDVIYFYDPNGNLIDSVEINSSIANGNGYSIEHFNNSFYESTVFNGTPGYENSISSGIAPLPQETKNIVLETYLNEIIYINTKYTQLFKLKIEDKDSCSEKDTITVSYNITNSGLIKQDEFTKEVGCSGYASTGVFTPTTAGDYILCGTIISSTINETDLSDNSACKNFIVIDTSSIPCNITLNITSDKETYFEGESVKFYNNLNNKTFPFTIEYWIEDYFGNIYKNKYNTTNTNQKSWKTKISEQDRILFIKSNTYPICNDSNISDNSAEKMFIVLANDTAVNREESSLEIIKTDDKTKFGDIVDVKVEIYKGKTSKYSISLWAEDNGEKISETTKIHLYDKYSSYNGQLPVKLDPNCNEEFDDGDYDIIIKGLDKEDKKEIKIEGIKTSACPKTSSTTTSTTSKTSSSKKFEYEIIEIPETISNNEVNTKIKLSNNDNDDYDIKMWSYLYRGSKCYSGEREANKKQFSLQAGTSEIINMENNIIEAEPGDYKYKIVINKDNQKTNKEAIKEITIEDTKAVKKEQIALTGKAADKDSEKETETTSTSIPKLKLQPRTIYESVDEKIKKLTFVFLITLSVLLNIVLFWRR